MTTSDKKFTPIQIGDSCLVVTGILLAERKDLPGDARGQFRLLMEVENGNREGEPEKGHVLWVAAIDGRDIDDERVWTDNPTLFNFHCGDFSEEFSDWQSYEQPDSPDTMTSEIKGILDKCIVEVTHETLIEKM